MKATFVLLLVVLSGGLTAVTAPLLPHGMPVEPAWMLLSGAGLLAAASALRKVSS